MDYSSLAYAAILALPPVIFWGLFYYEKDKMKPEPLRLLLLSFVVGMAVAGALRMVGMGWLKSGWGWEINSVLLIAVLAFLEEWGKHLGVVVMVERAGVVFDQLIDGIIYAVAGALGFAFLENIFYFTVAQAQGGVAADLVVFRGAVTMVGHTVFSAIFGYFYALSQLAKKVLKAKSYPLYRVDKCVFEALKMHVFFSHVVKGRKSVRGHTGAVLVAEGLIAATGVHFLFNFFLVTEVGGVSLAFLTIPLIGGIAFMLVKLMRSKAVLKVLS